MLWWLDSQFRNEKGWLVRGVIEGLRPSKEIIILLPLAKGKEIKGMGLINRFKLRLVWRVWGRKVQRLP